MKIANTTNKAFNIAIEQFHWACRFTPQKKVIFQLYQMVKMVIYQMFQFKNGVFPILSIQNGDLPTLDGWFTRSTWWVSTVQIFFQDFVEQPPFDMEASLEESTAITPFFFVLFPGRVRSSKWWVFWSPFLVKNPRDFTRFSESGFPWWIFHGANLEKTMVIFLEDFWKSPDKSPWFSQSF